MFYFNKNVIGLIFCTFIVTPIYAAKDTSPVTGASASISVSSQPSTPGGF